MKSDLQKTADPGKKLPKGRWFVVGIVLASTLCCGIYFLAGLRPRPEVVDCFMLPVEPMAVTVPFGEADATGLVHLGEDIPYPRGARVVSTARGYVAFAGAVEDHGGLVVLEHRLEDGGAMLSIYGNLDPEGIDVEKGELIERGRSLGTMASEPREQGLTSPHLHLGFRMGSFERRWNIYGWGPPEMLDQYLAPSAFLQEHGCDGAG